jgi:hypothetical protein
VENEFTEYCSVYFDFGCGGAASICVRCLKIEIPEEAFNVIVFGIVTWIVSLIFKPVAEKIAFKVRSFLSR